MGCQNLSTTKRSGFEVSPGLEGWGSESGTGNLGPKPMGEGTMGKRNGTMWKEEKRRWDWRWHLELATWQADLGLVVEESGAGVRCTGNWLLETKKHSYGRWQEVWACDLELATWQVDLGLVVEDAAYCITNEQSLYYNCTIIKQLLYEHLVFCCSWHHLSFWCFIVLLLNNNCTKIVQLLYNYWMSICSLLFPSWQPCQRFSEW